MEMYERLKELRKELGKTQKEFAEMLGVGQSSLAMIEIGQRRLSDRNIKTICALCSVNEKWLRSGVGEMFTYSDESLLAQLAEQYQLDDEHVMLIKCFLNLTDRQRGVIVNAVCDAAAAVQQVREKRRAASIDAKVEAYRQELEAAEKGQSLSTTGSDATADNQKDA